MSVAVAIVVGSGSPHVRSSVAGTLANVGAVVSSIVTI